VLDAQLAEWRKSIEIDGRATAPAEVRRLRFEGDKTWLELTLREGRNRQVRRLGEATGALVMRLARISHAGITAEDLRPGQWRHLTLDELAALKNEFGVPHRVRAAGAEAWEIQVKSNARVPRTAVQKRGQDPRSRREASASAKARPTAARAERREFTGKDRFTRDRVVVSRTEHDAKARAGHARTERTVNPHADRSTAGRPERVSSARPERGSSRQEQRPAKDAATPSHPPANSRGARVSARRRGT
jgi:23S rRNA pseudouridine2605 synthase